MRIMILELTRKPFEAFGKILKPSEKEIPKVKENNLFNFFVFFKEFSNGWQIGYLEQLGKYLKMLECHPNTPEVFVPLKGEAVILTAIEPEKEIIAFKLDKPIVLNQGVWHGVISLSEKSEILIAENEGVTDEFYVLGEKLEVSY